MSTSFGAKLSDSGRSKSSVGGCCSIHVDEARGSVDDRKAVHSIGIDCRPAAEVGVVMLTDFWTMSVISAEAV